MKARRGAGALLAIFGMVVIAVVILGVVFFLWYKAGYDKAIRLDEAAEKAWSDVDAQLQRRLELIPNLVETVRGYASHESDLFKSIAASREKYFQAGDRAGKIEASNQLTGFLSRLLVLQERYPQLKANENFRDLQVALEGTENRIAVARTRYNAAVEALNGFARSLLGKFFASKAGVEPKAYFEATEQAKTEVPQVNFSAPVPAPEPAPQPRP